MSLARSIMLLFSICLHGSVAGVLFFFSGNELGADETVYHVSLAEFAPVEVAAPQPVEPESAAAPEPEPEPAPPEPPKEPEAKKISAKKKPEKPKTDKPKKTEPKTLPNPSPASGPVGPQPRQVGGLAAYKSDHVDQRPSIARRVAPEYPSKAKRMNIEGRVLVQMVVDTSGSPKSCTVQSADPPGYFEDAALVAANKMRFIPGKIKGQPVNTLVILPFAFQLR